MIMTTQDRPPDRDELLAMAYVDDELDVAERSAFESRLAQDERLRQEVSQLRKLEVLARRVAPPEPADLVWAELDRDALHRTGLSTGLLLCGAGVAVVALGVVALVLRASALPLALRIGIVAVILGAAILYGTLLRARLRTIPHDPYTEVRR